MQGAPTIAISNPDGGDLIQHLSYGRASATEACKDGYGQSWAQWMNDGRGGFTCDMDIDWGKAAQNPQVVSVTINGVNDWAAVNWRSDSIGSTNQWVLGCALTPQNMWPTVVTNCPPS